MTRVRALDADGDMQFGNGASDFLVDVPAAVAQRAQTRLELQVGDWFLATDDGTPYRTAVLGRRTDATRDPAIKARILGTPGCTAIVAYASQLDRRTRGWDVQARIDTAYGQDLVATTVAAPNGDVRYSR